MDDFLRRGPLSSVSEKHEMFEIDEILSASVEGVILHPELPTHPSLSPSKIHPPIPARTGSVSFKIMPREETFPGPEAVQLSLACITWRYQSA